MQTLYQSATFDVPALDCPEELALIERTLRRVEGVGDIAPDYLDRRLRVGYDPAQVNASGIVAAIEAAGFSAQLGGERPAAKSTGETQAPSRIPISPIVAAGGALLAAAVALRFAIGETNLVVAGLLIASTIISGTRVAAAAWRAVRLHSLDMNALMTIAATGAIAIGDYFEAATAMFLFAVSLWLERLSLARAQRAIRSLMALTPNVARRLIERGTENEQVEEVDPATLAIGDYVLVRPGERIAADGVVRSGESAVNQAPITGESIPVEKRAESGVFAGTLNGEGSLVVEVTRVAGDTMLSHIARLIDEARAARSPTERFVDAFARRYTPAVILVAALTMLVPALLLALGVQLPGDATALDWVNRGLVLLVIACPCALVISTPVTIVSGLHQATRLGILVKGGEFLERAATIDCVALDKTGTLTTGAMRIVDIETFNGGSQEELLAIAAGLERHSEHPLAKAIVAAARERGVAPIATSGVSALRGMGVQGQLNGDEYFLGNGRLFEQAEFSLSPADQQRLAASATGSANGSLLTTQIWIGNRRQLLGRIQVADQPRGEARAAMADLRALGVNRIAMLTGDHRAVAEKVARDVGIDEVHAELLPQDKIDRVRAMSAEASLAMVGDGVNDAPALAAADVGIALGGQASETAMETAHVVVMSADLAKVPALIRLSRRCRRLLKQNIAFALGTKLLVMSLAITGLATMWMAVAADVGASMIVVANGMRMLRGAEGSKSGKVEE